jgi:hypothetical protein
VFQPETPLHGGVAGADLDQQFGQTLDSERLKVLEVRVFFEGTT